MIKFKIKPKLKWSKLFKDKTIEVKSLDADLTYVHTISDDVTLDTQVQADLNFQTSSSCSSRVKAAKFFFTKKF